jgi:hypothetical protein
LLLEQRKLGLLTFFLVIRRDFRELELQCRDCRRVSVELVSSLFGIFRLRDLLDSFGDGSRHRATFIPYDSLENFRQNCRRNPKQRIHSSKAQRQAGYDLR